MRRGVELTRILAALGAALLAAPAAQAQRPATPAPGSAVPGPMTPGPVTPSPVTPNPAAPPAAAPAAPPAAAAREPRPYADSLMRSFVEDGLSHFLDRLLAETALGRDLAARTAITDNRARAIRNVEALGQPMDLQFVGSRRYGPSFLTLCYMVRYRRSPLLFSFDVYDAGTGWDVIYYAYNDYAHISDWACNNAAPLEPG